MNVEHGEIAKLADMSGIYDIFVCSASYEARSVSVAQNIRRESIRSLILAWNVDSHPKTFEHRDSVRKRFEKSKIVDAQLSRSDPVHTADALNVALNDCHSKGPMRLLVDITTFTREAVLILVKLFELRLRPEDSVEFIYSHAAEYSVGDVASEKWLSRGIREIRSVLGYPGGLLPNRGTHLIVLVGFEFERAVALIREHEPTSISIGRGTEHEKGQEPHRDTHELQVRSLQRMFGRADEFVFKCYDPIETSTAITKRIEANPKCNSIIAPMSTKISTLGAALVARQNPAVQLCYAEAGVYNYEKYSTPDKDYYRFELPELWR